MMLNDSDIKAMLDCLQVITPKPAIIQPASVDLHLGHGIKLFKRFDREYSSEVILDPQENTTMESIRLPVGKSYIMQPCEFLLASTLEKVSMPSNLVARVEGKSSLGRIGLAVHITSGFIDPGFIGNITLELKNMSNLRLRLRANMPICQICFYKLTAPAEKIYGDKSLGSKYQNSIGTVPAKSN